VSVFEKLGGEITVNTTYARTQAQSEVTTLADGRFLVVWVDADFTVYSNRYLRAQIFEADGTAVGTELTLTGPVDRMNEPSVAALEGGGFVTVWRDIWSMNVQRYDGDGTPVGSAIVVTTSEITGPVEVTATAGGGFAVAWIRDRSEDQSTIQLRTYDANGVATSGEVTVNGSVLEDYSVNYVNVAVAALAGGNVVVTWFDVNGSGGNDNAYMARVFTAAGVPLGAEFAVSTVGDFVTYGEAAVVALANGNFAISWTQLADPEGILATHTQIFTASGASVGEPILSLSNAFDSPALAALSDGSLAVVYRMGGLFVQVYNPDGSARGAPIQIEAQTIGAQVDPSISALDDGGFVVTWTDYNGAGADDDQVKAQVFGPVPELVSISSNGGGEMANVAVGENGLVATAVTATGGEAALSFSIAGGTDAALFAIDAGTGALTFVAAPDYEAPADANGDNIYQVIVRASDGTREDTQSLSVTVGNLNDIAPVISGYPSNAAIDVVENSVVVADFAATDADGSAVTFSLSGADANRFSVDAATGLVQFLAAPDYEAPGSSQGTNAYQITLTASDGVFSDVLNLTVNVTDVGLNIGSNGGGDTGAFSLPENQTVATTVVARDAAGAVAYTISGGSDAARFTIDAQTGVLSFVTAPNYEAPNDVGANRVYDVVVAATDGSLTDTQALAITITNINEAPVITSNGGGDTAAISVNEAGFVSVTTVVATDPENTARTYSIVGGADAGRFIINASGFLSFSGVVNYEAPTDADANNVYEVVVRASDGTLGDTQAIFVTVLNVNETPQITSPATYSVQENVALVGTVTATDPEGQPLTYSLGGGVDAAFFTINSTTGALSFIAARNFEAPADSGANNVYNVNVVASDGTASGVRALSITVTNVNEAPVITSNGGGATAALTYFENNTSAVTTVTSTDPENTTRTYSISGGADAARFSIVSSTGQLSFLSSPNFEAPTDAGANNVYEVTVRASDGSLWDEQALSITVANLNEAPVITSNGGGTTAAVTVSENSVAVTTVTSTDQENSARTYSISGGTDSSRFTINATTGVLTFVAAPNREAPVDTNGDNVYNVIVRASDGSLADTQSIAVTVANVNEAVTITSGSAFTVAENGLAVTTVTATDLDGTAPTFSITGGADAARFTINAATGALSFVATPDFEAPDDDGGNNVYDVTVTASDGSLSDTRALTVTVVNVAEAPVIVSNGGGASAAVSVTENALAVATVAASDPEGGVTYSLTGGADAALFAIDAGTGALTFLAAPNFEAPDDADGDNIYKVVVGASDGNLSDTQSLSVTVGNLNEAPVIASNGGGASAALAVSENGTAVTTVAATDPEGGLSYAIAGGADAALFTVDAETGALSFVAAPDFETPADADGDNIYEVMVSASDGSFADTQVLSVTVGDINEAPVISSNGGGATAALTVSENQAAVTTVAAADPEGGLSYALAGGTDAALFVLNAETGALSFVAAPDYEAPADADGDNVYEVIVSASDGNLSDTQSLSITVGNVNEAPVVTSNGGGASATVSVDENTTAVTTVVASDPENGLSYSIAGGADAALFALDASTGALSFLAAPSHEAPGDTNGDNVYEVVVSAADGALSDTQALSVTVGDVDEAPVILTEGFTIYEGNGYPGDIEALDEEQDGLLYSIVGGPDAALFRMVAPLGELNFRFASPNFEAPGDADGDNVYELVIAVQDGTTQVTRSITVTVLDANEQPVIVSDGGGPASLTVVEGTSAVTTVVAVDEEGPVAYSIAGGADAARFAIDASTGALSFAALPDFEAPTDANGNNVYEVVVRASDGEQMAFQTLSISVGNANETPVIGSNGGGASAAVSIGENTTAVTTVTARDPEGGVTFALAGGADAARFAIDAGTGALRFVAAPNFEAPADANGDNVYEVVVSASDGSLSDTQALSVTVGNVNEAPVIVSNGGGASAAVSMSENATAVTTVGASDPEGGVTYALAGGADAARFAIDAATGALIFVTAPNFEAPADANGNNVFEVVVSASDGSLTDTQTLSVTVSNINEAPMITSGGGGASASYALNENAAAVATVAATDSEGGVTYALAGGADAALFTINASTGALSFVTAPDFDAPTDAGGNNVYEVIVSASDGSLVDTQGLAVTVGNVSDGLTLTGTSQANTLNGSYEEDSISGLGGNDTLRGLAAADVLDGGDGADRLIGGAGADMLTGGLKADIFEFETLSDSTIAASDRILDFNRSQGDKIELVDIDANSVLGGNQAFSFIGTAAFSNVAGQLRYFQQDGDTFVAGDVNGDGAADFQLVLDPLVSLISSDFLL
jgi:hypothetical protein